MGPFVFTMVHPHCPVSPSQDHSLVSSMPCTVSTGVPEVLALGFSVPQCLSHIECMALQDNVRKLPVCYHSKWHVKCTQSTLDEMGFVNVQQISMLIFNVCRLEVYMMASSVEKEMNTR